MSSMFVSVVFSAILFLNITSFSHAATEPESDYEKIRVLMDVLEQVQTNYVEEINFKELVYSAAGGVVHTLDPFSQFMPPAGLKEMRVETEGEFGGIGIRIGVGEDGWLTVISPIPGTPAFRMGVLPRDRIIKINGESTESITTDKAVSKLRGKPGAKVTITVERDGESASGAIPTKINKDITLEREVIKIQTVYSRMIEGSDVGHIRITEFNAKTPQEMHEALGKLSKAGMKSLILDVRNNPGGLLPSAIETIKELLGDQKLIVYTQGRRPDSRVDYRAASHAPYGNVPMIVLVNRGSASVSEILAGASQDNKRAIVMGSRSFGKASVQSVISLPDGSGLRLTTAYYYTPSGRLLHKKEYVRKKHEDEEDTETPKAKPAAGASAKESAAKPEKPQETWGIEPDIVVNVDPETEAKVQASFDLVYFPDKPAQPFREVFKKELEKRDKEQKQNKPADSAQNEVTDKKDQPAQDMVLERAAEILKARKLFLNPTETAGQ